MKKINITAKNNRGTHMEITYKVMDGTKEIESGVVKGRSKQELDGTLNNILNLANQVETDFALITEGEWTAPVVEEPTPEPEPIKTQEEIDREAWLEQWKKYKAAKQGMAELKDAGVTPTPEEQTAFEALKKWAADNRKPEYTHYLSDVI